MIKALLFITIILTISVYGQQPDFEWEKFMGADSCVGLKDQDNQSITVFLNPFHQAFTIEFNKTGNHTFEMLNSLGQTITTDRTEDQSTQISTFDLSHEVCFICIVEENSSFMWVRK